MQRSCAFLTFNTPGNCAGVSEATLNLAALFPATHFVGRVPTERHRPNSHIRQPDQIWLLGVGGGAVDRREQRGNSHAPNFMGPSWAAPYLGARASAGRR